MNTVFGIFLGAILTYFFNILVKKKEYKTIYEEQYVSKVCIPILKFLRKTGTVSTQDIFNYVDQIFDDNLICISDTDRQKINSLKVESNKTVTELCTCLQNYFQNSVDCYKRKRDNSYFIHHRNYIIFLKTLVFAICVIGFSFFTIGIAGALGIYGWDFTLFNWEDSSIFYIGLCFADFFEIIKFIIIGALLIIASVILYKKIIIRFSKDNET